jgi:ABC-type branched-subunit amino acid transport system substrate-binding protein
LSGFRNRPWNLITVAFAVGALIGATSAIQLAPRLTVKQALAGSPSAGDNAGDSGSALGASPSLEPAGPAAKSGQQSPRSSNAVASKPACSRSANVGVKTPGVSPNSIKLATTTVESGPGAAFLGEVKYAMEAVRNKVNRAGGICGRKLEITYVDDGWDAGRGAGYLRNFIQSGVFAIPVAPSSEGLRVVIDSGDIKSNAIPVVGTDGMLIDQYTDPWVWPVAVATATSARIMARNAYERGARKFSIVFDKNYRFGVEAAQAYNDEVKHLTHANVDGYNASNNCVKSFCGILAAQSSYATEVNQFSPGDYVAMFLEPQTALTWMATAGSPKPFVITYGIGAGQPLFTRDFANSCQDSCDGMWVWTGYKPPIEAYANEPAVRTFVKDMQQTKPDADVDNAFSMGGYVGMELFVEALQRVGSDLTRERLKVALDELTAANGLTLQKQLDWRSNHFANNTMQAFAIRYKGTFSGWRAQDTERTSR